MLNTESYTENNKVVIAGTVASVPEFSHEVYEEMFYTFMLDTPRLSETRDTLKVTISEKFLIGDGLHLGDRVLIHGQFRSYNNFTNVGNRLLLTVFVKDIEAYDYSIEKSMNSIYLNGYICKKPVYRTTPFGREIPMYIGMVGAENRSFRDRITEHSKYYFSRPEFYTGISRTELEEGYKFLVRILAIEDDEEKRYSIEQNLIEIMKPYLQYGCYPKYKSDYRGFDLAIFPTYRRRAFLVARDGKYEELNAI